MKAIDIFYFLSEEDARSEKGHWLYECKICKKRYRSPGKLLVKHFRQHSRKGEIIMNEPKTEEKQTLYHGKPAVNEEEFASIKELDFRGEAKMDIIRMSGRSYETVKRILEAKDFNEYKSGTKWIKPKPKSNPMATQYSKLQIVKQQFDATLAEFVVTTAQNLNNDLWTENALLHQQNEELKKSLEKYEKQPEDSFLNTLQSRLQPANQTQPTLLPVHPDRMNRLCYLREDLVKVMSVEKLDMFVAQMKNENKAGGKSAIIEINEKEAYPIRELMKFLQG